MAETKRRVVPIEERQHYNLILIWQRRYAHIKARAEGRSTNKSAALGKELIGYDDFFDWCKDKENFDVFLSLYYDWMQSDFSLWFSPSIDRIDPKRGYTADNIQWLSFSENCRKNNKDPITHRDMAET